MLVNSRFSLFSWTILPFIWNPSTSSVVESKYASQKHNSEYAAFLSTGVHVSGIWDDHDFNMNNGSVSTCVGELVVRRVMATRRKVQSDERNHATDISIFSE